MKIIKTILVFIIAFFLLSSTVSAQWWAGDGGFDPGGTSGGSEVDEACATNNCIISDTVFGGMQTNESGCGRPAFQ